MIPIKCKYGHDLTNLVNLYIYPNGKYYRCKSCRNNSMKNVSNSKKTKAVLKYRHNNVQATLRHRLTTQFNQSLRRHNLFGYKSDSITNLLGCSLVELKKHLENQFKEGMTWENKHLWHIDHKRPLSSFDLKNKEDQKICFHFSNLQPLWAIDNLIKSDRWW